MSHSNVTPGDGLRVIRRVSIEGTTLNPSTANSTPASAPLLAEMTYTFTPKKATNLIEIVFNGSFRGDVNGWRNIRTGIWVNSTLMADTERRVNGNNNNGRHTSSTTVWEGSLPASEQVIEVRFWIVGGDTAVAIENFRTLKVREYGS